MVVANDGSPTFLCEPDTTSAIDVTLHSLDLPVTWRISPSADGSDHYPIHIDFNEELASNSRIKKVICWDDFRSALDSANGDPLDAIARYLELATRSVGVPANILTQTCRCTTSWQRGNGHSGNTVGAAQQRINTRSRKLAGRFSGTVDGYDEHSGLRSVNH